MKSAFVTLTATGILALLLTGCNKYPGYKEVYNKDGLIILSKQGEKFDSLTNKTYNTPMPFVGVDPKDGKPIVKTEAIAAIKLYQDPLDAAGDTITARYVDFYFKNLHDYLAEIIATQNQGGDLTKVGMRFYFAGTSPKHSIILGPILNTSAAGTTINQIVDPLWFTRETEYTAFNFGSLCPDNCTNDNDYSGYAKPK